MAELTEYLFPVDKFLDTEICDVAVAHWFRLGDLSQTYEEILDVIKECKVEITTVGALCRFK